MTLRKLIGIITGSRQRRWERLQSIYEHHKHECERRELVYALRNAATLQEQYRAKCALEYHDQMRWFVWGFRLDTKI